MSPDPKEQEKGSFEKAQVFIARQEQLKVDLQDVCDTISPPYYDFDIDNASGKLQGIIDNL